MEEWKECKLGEICTKITDGSHFSPQACQTGYPMFSVKDMLEYGFDYSNCKHISAKDFESMKNGDCVPQKGDILVAKDGSFLKQIFECKRRSYSFINCDVQTKPRFYYTYILVIFIKIT